MGLGSTGGTYMDTLDLMAFKVIWGLFGTLATFPQLYDLNMIFSFRMLLLLYFMIFSIKRFIAPRDSPHKSDFLDF